MVFAGGTVNGWYRKWKSGVVEQGGYNPVENYPVVTLPITMADTNYNMFISKKTGSTQGIPRFDAWTVSTVSIGSANVANSCDGDWWIRGIMAM